MKIFFSVALLMFVAVPAFAQPDPRDSVILESKTVYPGVRGDTDTSAYLYIKVYITNKDSLTYLAISFLEKSTSGGAYAVLGRPRTFQGIVSFLTPYTFRYLQARNTNSYHSDSPDTFLLGAGLDPGIGPETIEPPNAVRKAVWEIKFDSVWNITGTFELDTVSNPLSLPAGAVQFTNTEPRDMPVNFVKSVITVRLLPDPRDSVILESKTVVPGAGHPYTTVTVYITNKDSLTFLMLPLIERSTSGSAYGILSKASNGNRSFSAVINPLALNFRYGSAAQFSRYNSTSPDTFLVAAGFDPADPSTIEPPNATRKALWEFKFDTIRNDLGTFELDSTFFPFNMGPTFTNTVPTDMPTNFVKSIITVAYPKGDLNQDVALSPADVVWILNCVMLGTPPPGGVSSCDLNCDGMGTPADIVLELNAVFLGEGFPC